MPRPRVTGFRRSFFDTASTLQPPPDSRPILNPELSKRLDHLFPVLVPPSWTSSDTTHIPTQPLLTAPHLDQTTIPQIAVAVEESGQLNYVTHKDLKTWSCSIEAAVRASSINIDRSPLDLQKHIVTADIAHLKIIQIDMGKRFEASRVLLPSLSETLQPLLQCDVFWVGIPNRHLLLVSPALGSFEDLQTFSGVVRYYHDSRPLPLSKDIFLYGPPGPSLQDIVDL